MLELFFLVKTLIGVFFLTIASYQDLKTTEISDKLLYAFLIISVLVNLLQSVESKSMNEIKNSMINGLVLSLIGIAMYMSGQWGAGDSFLLASIGFLNPLSKGLVFSFEYFFVLSVSGMLYVIAYSFIIYYKNRKAKKAVSNEFSKHSKKIGIISIFLILSTLIYIVTRSYEYFILSNAIFAILVLSIVFVYLKGVEESMMKRIPVNKVKIGDVLKESKKWVGIDEKTLKKIRKSRRFVYIKEGVRFAPAFIIAFIIVIYWGHIPETIISFLRQLFSL